MLGPRGAPGLSPLLRLAVHSVELAVAALDARFCIVITSWRGVPSAFINTLMWEGATEGSAQAHAGLLALSESLLRLAEEGATELRRLSGVPFRL